MPDTTTDLTPFRQRAAIGRAMRRYQKTGDPDDLREVENLRREYRAARLAEQIEQTVEQYPSLTEDQVNHLSGLLRGGAK